MQIVKTSSIALIAIVNCSLVVGAQGQTGKPAAPSIKACSLLPKDEVRKHVPWNDLSRTRSSLSCREAALDA